MASRPPEPTEQQARQRWMIIQMQRLIGVAMIFLGLSVLQGLIDLSEMAAYVFIGVGLVDVFLVPTILARLWRTPSE